MRSKSPGKLILVAECARRKIAQSGSVKQLLHRLQKSDEKMQREKGLKTSDKQHKTDKNMEGIHKNKYKTRISSFSMPLTCSAKEYVQVHCNGDLSKAQPQWVHATKVRLMIPDMRGSKVGPNLRWVMYKE